jgi:thymidylate synthase (FAD)
MKVELITHTPDPEKICAIAAHSWCAKDFTASSSEQLTDGEINNILKKMMKIGHHSVIEHANFTFYISDVSRVLSHQLVRHRIASYSQQSQKCVQLNEPSFITPQSIKKNPEANEKYRKIMDEIWEGYRFLINEGIDADDARLILPNATTTAIIVTMNARELRHFFEVRCCMRANWEIRKMAYAMLKEVRKVAPIFFEESGPRCDICQEPLLNCKKNTKKK